MVETSNAGFQLYKWTKGLAWSRRTLLAMLWVVGLATVLLWYWSPVEDGGSGGFGAFWGVRQGHLPLRLRSRAFNLTDFDGVGDGVTVNTKAFERAVAAIALMGEKGGGQLNVQRGLLWRTTPFNQATFGFSLVRGKKEVKEVEWLFRISFNVRYNG